MASDKKICRGYIKNIVLSIIATVLLTLLIWASIPPGLAKPSGLLLEVVGDSFQMDESLQGNVTLQFTLRAENPTSCNITYTNISGTLAVLNEHGEKEGHFLRFNVRDFDVQQQAFVESSNQVTVTQLNFTENNIGVVLQLNGTMEITSNRNKTAAGYRCHIRTSRDDEPCSRAKQPTV